MNIAIIFAGGVGSRMNNKLPKQFMLLKEKPIIIHTIFAFENHKEIDKIYISCIPDYIEILKKEIEKYGIKKVAKIVSGGNTSQISIRNALLVARKENGADSIVLISDGVRPFIKKSLISKNIEAVKKYGSCITCYKSHETPILVKENKILNVYDRYEFRNAKAPQSFYLEEILNVQNKYYNQNKMDFIDAATMFYADKKEIYTLDSYEENIKITTSFDYEISKMIISYFDFEE